MPGGSLRTNPLAWARKFMPDGVPHLFPEQKRMLKWIVEAKGRLCVTMPSRVGWARARQLLCSHDWVMVSRSWGIGFDRRTDQCVRCGLMKRVF